MSLIVFIYSDVNLNASFLNKRIIDSEFLNRYPFLVNKKQVYEIKRSFDISELRAELEDLKSGDYEIGIASFEETESFDEVERFNKIKTNEITVDIIMKNSGFYKLKYVLENKNFPLNTVFLIKNVTSDF